MFYKDIFSKCVREKSKQAQKEEQTPASESGSMAVIKGKLYSVKNLQMRMSWHSGGTYTDCPNFQRHLKCLHSPEKKIQC